MVALTSLRTCIQRFRTSHPIRSMWSLLDVSMSRWCTIASCNSSLWIGPVGRCDRTSLPTPTRNWLRSSSTTNRFVFYTDFAIQMHYPSSYIISIHTKDTTRTSKVEKLLQLVFHECQKRGIPPSEQSQFIHNVDLLSPMNPSS